MENNRFCIAILLLYKYLAMVVIADVDLISYA